MHSPAVIEALSKPVPRYTSYPTAVSFTNTVGADAYENALAALPSSQALSVYIHVPYCHQLCWYCGCSARVANNDELVDLYVSNLLREIELVRSKLQHRPRVSHVHFGGGSPNRLSPNQITRIMNRLRLVFDLAEDAEIAAELDPRWLSQAHITALVLNGVNRVSLGVQDFEPKVQRAINRMQSLELTQAAVDNLRQAGIPKCNIDLVYGLPHQTRQSLTSTIENVLALEPDRIALFGYAHIPSKIKHQRLIDDAAVPGVMERYQLLKRAQRLILQAGYKACGVDHFAKPDDPLATQEIRRNFQGYTTDDAQNLLAFGPSAISRLDTGYYQNITTPKDYQDCIAAGDLPTARGVLLSSDDVIRAFVIERLMCDYTFSISTLAEHFGDQAISDVLEDAGSLVENNPYDLIEPTTDGFRVSEAGKPFVRSVAACFDTYLNGGSGAAKHSVGF